jgi:hypothetical protein
MANWAANAAPSSSGFPFAIRSYPSGPVVGLSSPRLFAAKLETSPMNNAMAPESSSGLTVGVNKSMTF